MKKFLIVFMALLVIFGLVGCEKVSQLYEKATQSTNSVKSKSTQTKLFGSEFFPKNAVEVGKGNISINTPSGTSEDGNVPVKFLQKNTSVDRIGVDLGGFQGDKLVFLFVSDILVSKIQGGEMVQTSINLEKQNLNPGIYTLSAIQFENNDPKGKVIEFHQAKYEIKQQ